VGAAKTKSASDFYTAGGGITGFQNGLAIAGDYMSAASFLGISAAVFLNGYDGLIYAIGFLVGWPIITFLMAERLRNLGRYTFADVAAYRFKQAPIRIFSASGTLVVVAFYLIAQMVGAGQLIKLLFGLEYWIAVVLVGTLMMIYVLFGGMTATTWVQIIKAVMLLGGATFMAVAVLAQFNFSPEALFAKSVDVHAAKEAIMGPGSFIKDPISAISFGMALMFGTAGLPHILMRFFTVPSAKEARKSVFWATTWIAYFYILTFIIGFGAIVLVSTNPEFKDAAGKLLGGNNMAAVHLAKAVGGNVFLGFMSAVAFCHHPGRRGGFDPVGRRRPCRTICMHRHQEGQGHGRQRIESVARDHHRAGHYRRRAGYCLREAEYRLHGLAGLRHRRLGQLPRAVHVGAVERLHHAGRHHRRLPGLDHGRRADGGVEVRVGRRAGPSAALFPYARRRCSR